VAPLDGHYLPARYPISVPDSIPARIYNRAIAVEALQMADRVLELVRRKLREDL
jgi:HEPN domain-containing protein